MSGATKDGGPAFANGAFQRGMDLRDWFAGQALPGVMDLCRDDTPQEGETVPEALARKAFEVADAMIAARGQS